MSIYYVNINFYESIEHISMIKFVKCELANYFQFPYSIA